MITVNIAPRLWTWGDVSYTAPFQVHQYLLPATGAFLIDEPQLSDTVLYMKLRVLRHSSPATPLSVIACSLTIQLLLERYVKPVGRLLRAPFILWVLSAAYAGLGVRALEVGPWVVIDGRFMRRSDLTAVLVAKRPDAVSPRRSRVFILTVHGSRTAVRGDAQELAAFLDLPIRPL